MRFDVFLTEKEYFESRNKASAAIKNRQFSVNGKIIDKPSYDITENDTVASVFAKTTYVARSAQKLLTAIENFNLDFKGKTIVDLGASTGGFCQVLLENDVSLIYAVDIGTAQLHPSIKSDSRVINMEHTNARYLTKDNFPSLIDVVTADLSFISLKMILPTIFDILISDGEAIVLVKPQFEAGPQHLSKSGVVHDLKIHRKILIEITEFCKTIGFGVKDISFSGLAGESGNREYLLYLIKEGQSCPNISDKIQSAISMEENNG